MWRIAGPMRSTHDSCGTACQPMSVHSASRHAANRYPPALPDASMSSAIPSNAMIHTTNAMMSGFKGLEIAQTVSFGKVSGGGALAAMFGTRTKSIVSGPLGSGFMVR